MTRDAAREAVAREFDRHQALRGPMEDARPEVWQNRCECGWDDGDDHPGWRARYQRHLADAVLSPPEVQALIGGQPSGVLAEVAAERGRQNLKWGEQNHPDLSPQLKPTADRVRRFWLRDVARYYGLPIAEYAKRLTDDDAASGDCSWLAIATEELAEAAEAAADGDSVALRAELVQVAAVAVQWVQAIDRRTGDGE